jgi:uncharacterized protein (DUF362 family)/Pyruvate/2-oxoacid:ferredoxin oxidoreductase delta subunit
MKSARVSIVRCRSYDRDEVRAAVARAVELLGGAARFLPAGGGVLLKPNLLWASARERRVCTDPEVVRAVAELFRAAGAAEVAAGDSPGMGSALKVMSRCGWDGVVPEWVRRLDFDSGRRQPSRSHPDLELSSAALDTGLLVNLPKVKTHAYMGLTLAVKNLFGCVVGPRKAQWHLRAGENRGLFARLLAEIAYSFRPGLAVVDGIVAMEGNGPGSGDARPLGLIVAGDDPSAVDAVLCRIVGFALQAVPTLAAARELGLGQPDLAGVEVLGERIEDVAVRGFRPAASNAAQLGFGLPRALQALVRGALTSKPVVGTKLCRLCGRCAEICPPKAIAMDAAARRFPEIDRARCIRCFCCQEVCPHGAIGVRPGWALRLAGLLHQRPSDT